jgi:hypothetical protein
MSSFLQAKLNIKELSVATQLRLAPVGVKPARPAAWSACRHHQDRGHG